jgi:hypothetical protein
MIRVTIDETLRSKLHNLTEPLELCDNSGQVVGWYYPEEDLSQYDLTEPPISEEELRDREQSNDWVSGEEVLEYLRKLDNQ